MRSAPPSASPAHPATTLVPLTAVCEYCGVGIRPIDDDPLYPLTVGGNSRHHCQGLIRARYRASDAQRRAARHHDAASPEQSALELLADTNVPVHLRKPELVHTAPGRYRIWAIDIDNAAGVEFRYQLHASVHRENATGWLWLEPWQTTELTWVLNEIARDLFTAKRRRSQAAPVTAVPA